MQQFIKKLKQRNLFGSKNSLKRPLTYTFLAVGLIPLIFISILALWLTSNMASNQVSQNLEAIKANKVVAIEEYGNTIVNQVLTASSDPNLATNMSALIASFDSALTDAAAIGLNTNADYLISRLSNYYNGQFLPTYQDANPKGSLNVNTLLNQLSQEALLLQFAYIEANPNPLGNKHLMFKSDMNIAYDQSHDQLHQTFKDFLERFGYYDIFMVDTKGRVIYSVYKELDYATNLLSGPYASSGIAEAFKRSLQINDNEYVLVDYAQYTPSYEAPASFIASPIIKDGQRLGSLIFQMPLDAISTVMSEQNGLGETGESYLVGPDKLMRSDSLKYPDEYSVDASFRNQRKIESDAIVSGIAGKKGVIKARNYMDESVFSAYIPVKFGSLRWAMIAEIEQSEAYSTVTQLQWIVALVCLLAGVGIVFVAVRFSENIVAPIDTMRQAMASIAESTNFNERVNVNRDDEIGQTARSLNSLLEKMEHSIKDTNDVIAAMASGDFNQRVDADFKGDLLVLKEGVNTSAESMGSAIKQVNTVVSALAKGDFTQQIRIDLQGELAHLKLGVNASVEATANAMNNISSLMSAMSRGDFKYRVTDELVGEYAVIASQADEAMTSIDNALGEIEGVMAKVAVGELDSRVNIQLPGQLELIKDNLNTSLDAISSVFSQSENALEALAQGILYKTIDTEFPGRFNRLKAAINATATKLTDVVDEIKVAASTVSISTDEIAKGNNSLSVRTEEQVSNLERTASSMNEITVTVQHTADNANNANTIATEAKTKAFEGGSVVKDAISAMKDINQASAKIADIISVIDAIAFQTNLLALNAAVEAARAGEQGRGFAVVASEVRNLAGRSANAAKEIKGLIEDSVTKVQVGSNLVERSGSTLEDIISKVENVSTIVGEITIATDQQSSGVLEINHSVEALQSLTQQNTAMVEEAASASEQLSGQAANLSELIQFFSTKPSGELSTT